MLGRKHWGGRAGSLHDASSATEALGRGRALCWMRAEFLHVPKLLVEPRSKRSLGEPNGPSLPCSLPRVVSSPVSAEQIVPCYLSLKHHVQFIP